MAIDAQKVAQTLLDEHHGHAGAALLDLAGRYLWAIEGMSAGYKRLGMNDTGGDIKLDPPPVDDGAWIETGREG